MHVFAALAAIIVVFFPAAHSMAQESPALAPPQPEDEIESPEDAIDSPETRLTPGDVETWLDGFMTYALPRGDIAGGVVVVVRDGEVLFKKGYGYADVEEKKPVDPDLTLFRPGSVSKLVTWTAVMQLVEQGRVDLDADVNTYLDFEIPERYGTPVTMRNIMTHTPGFEEQAKGLMGVGRDVIALSAHLKRWVPERIFPPGEMPAYSNYATALAGYVVERVSGMSFDDYLDANIFEPLGMMHSTFRQPLPERLAPQMSQGYALASEPPRPFEIVGPAPAGSMSSPGVDMAKFMIAHLQKGAYGSNRILEPDTAEQMHNTPLTVLPEVNRMMLGFYETNYNGRRVVSHGGDTQWFHTYLHLFIDDGIGLYMSFNSSGKEGATGGIRTMLFHQFADRYLPGEAADGEVDADTAAEHARLIAGRYDNSRRMSTNFFSILNLIGAVKVVANDDGTISVPMMTGLDGQPRKWREIASFIWRETDGKSLLSAEVSDGRVVRFSFDDLSPFMMFEPVPGYRSSAWLLPALLAALGMLFLTTVAWPTAALVRRYYGARYGLAGSEAKAHFRVRLAALLALALFVVWATTISMMMSDYSLLSPALDGWLWVLQILSLVVFVGAAAVGVRNAWVVTRGQRRFTAKLWAVLLALSFAVLLWVALVYDLIAFDVNY